MTILTRRVGNEEMGKAVASADDAAHVGREEVVVEVIDKAVNGSVAMSSTNFGVSNGGYSPA